MRSASLNSFEFRGLFGRRWLHRETVDDRRGGETGLGGWSLVCFIYSSMLGGWTFAPCLRASAACQARRASSRLAATATKACRTEETVAGGHRTCTPTAEPPARTPARYHGALRRGAPAPRLRRRRAALPPATAAHVRQARHGAARRDADLPADFMFTMFILRHDWYVVHRRSYCFWHHIASRSVL